MKIISWNVNGIRACAKKGFLDFLEREEPDILCLQETKAEPEQVEPGVQSPLGYKSHWSSSRARKGYSGTATYICQDMEVEQVSRGIGEEKYDREGRFVVTQQKDFLLYNIYFPNGAASRERHDFKQDFLESLLKHLQQKMRQGHEIVVVGDYNIAHKEVDLYDPVRLKNTSGFLPEERAWFDSFLKAGFVDLFRHFHPEAKDVYTWWSYREMARPANRGWRIDYICATQGLLSRFRKCSVLAHQVGSDHCPVLVEME